LTAGIATIGPIASASAAGGVSAQDSAFMVANAQSNLAEISLGQLGQQRGQDAATKQLAAVTLADHQRLQTQLEGIAKTAGVTLPTTPNAMQLQVAATLTATPAASFDLAYAQAEVTGHQMAISAANTEIQTGSDSAVIGYANGYVPVATMHLNMATDEVTALGGVVPSSVSAGSGGMAAMTGSSSALPVAGIAGGAVVLLGVSGIGLARRRGRRTALMGATSAGH
jgi:putative membrane protein